MKMNRDLVPILREMYRLYLDHPEGVGDTFIAEYLGLHRRQVARYRLSMPGVYVVSRGRYSCVPTPHQIEVAYSIIRRAQLEARRNGALDDGGAP